MTTNPESLRGKVQDYLSLVPKSMCDDQEHTVKDLSLLDLSTSGTDSKPAETSSSLSRNNSQIPHEEKHGDRENGNYGCVLEISEGRVEVHRATDMPEDVLYTVRNRIKLAVVEVASGYELLGQVSVAKFENRNAAGDVKESVFGSELQEAAVRHDVACKEALAAARNVSLNWYSVSASCQGEQTRADIEKRLNSLTV